jgi:hypothetical protein
MNAIEFRETVLSLPVWDTHNHLESSKTLCAQTIWDVAHYFWFHRELWGVGYPHLDHAMAMPESERAEALAKALHASRNTMWNQAVRQTLRDLWNAEITDADSVLRASEAIGETGRAPGWAHEVCARVNIRKMAVASVTDNGIAEIEGRLHVMGSVRLPTGREIDEILMAPDVVSVVEDGVRAIGAAVAGQVSEGRRVFRVLPPNSVEAPEIQSAGTTPDELSEYLCHALFRALEEHGAHTQIFVGMERPTKGYVPRTKGERNHAVNDPRRIAALHDIFDMYADCSFEIVNAAQLSNLDIVQAARIYPNVAPGGLWWFNFRASTYREVMQYRIEALPATRCTLLASDARCIEWAYCKTLVVKRLLAEFLCDQVKRGWLDEEAALYVAKEWLHDAPARLYEPA